MSAFPNSPRLIKGGIVTMDPDTSVVKSVIAMQYNPDSLSRRLQIQAVQGGQDGVRVLKLGRMLLEPGVAGAGGSGSKWRCRVVRGLKP
jgi:hypothetical protein